MSRLMPIVLLCSALGLDGAGPLAASQAGDAAAHKALMDDAGDQQDELKELLAAGDGAKASAVAAQLAASMSKTEGYWRSKKAVDIVAIAQQSKALASDVTAAAKAGKIDAARAAFAKLNTTCNTCHDLHPEKR